MRDLNSRSRALVESLEPRQFLSASAFDPIVAQAAPELRLPWATYARPVISTSGGVAVGHYAGTLSAYARNVRIERDVILNLTDQSVGRLNGWAFIDGVGLQPVTGSVAGGRKVSLLFNNGIAGSFRGTLSPTRGLSGRFMGPVDDILMRGTLSVTRDGPAIRYESDPALGGFVGHTPSQTDGNPVPGLGNPVPPLGNPVPGFGR